jgi:flagellar brake protein
MPNSAHGNAVNQTANATNNSQYTVNSRLEITKILSAIMRQNTLITASPGEGSFFLTTIHSIDQDNNTLLLSCGRQQPQIEQVMQKQRLLCSTSLDKVKIEFVCEGISTLGTGTEMSFRMPLPRSLLRLQRREYFRAHVPMLTKIQCVISPLQADPSLPAEIELAVHDISSGGIAVITPATLFTPAMGNEYKVVIGLPGTPGVRAKIQARNAFMVTLPNGKVTQRSGFAFVDPSENVLAMIQRYIMNLERTRRQNSLDR